LDKKKKIDVDSAYSLGSPADNRQLYEKWAATYDEDFVDREGYIAHREVALLFAKQLGVGPVLDVGCGTGAVGLELRKCGVANIVGVDISEQMLAIAAGKRADDGTAVYKALILADLTQSLDLPSDIFKGIVSAGTFTHGHLGPEPLDELWRVAAPGAQCVLGIKTTHFDSLGFEEKLESDVSKGKISLPTRLETNIYATSVNCSRHAGDRIVMVACQVL